MTKIFETGLGKIKLRNCMIDIDGTNLVEGTSIYVDGKHITDVKECIDNLSLDECLTFIEFYT